MKKTILDNGLTIITDKKQGDFVTASYYVNVGSIDEPINSIGIAHLTEHQVFKGTVTRDKNKIWKDVQQFGGSLNAYTTELYTCYYCTIMKDYWKNALDVVSDIVWNNTIPEEEFELEKSVVIEELKMYNDDAQYRVYDLVKKTLFKNCRNRWNNGGTPQTVSNITREKLVDFITKNYIPKNVVLAFVGDVDHEEIVQFISKYIDGYEFVDSVQHNRQNVSFLNIEDAKDYIDGTQSTMASVWEVSCTNDKEDYLNELCASIIGGGFCSRMMEIREKYGFAYTVSCFSNTYGYNDKAYMEIYAGLNKENIEKTKEIILKNLKELKENGITEDEFNTAKIRTISSLKKKFLYCEDVVNMLFYSWSVCSKCLEEQDYLKVLNSITYNDLNEYMKNMINLDKIAFMVVEQKQ